MIVPIGPLRFGLCRIRTDHFPKLVWRPIYNNFGMPNIVQIVQNVFLFIIDLVENKLPSFAPITPSRTGLTCHLRHATVKLLVPILLNTDSLDTGICPRRSKRVWRQIYNKFGVSNRTLCKTVCVFIFDLVKNKLRSFAPTIASGLTRLLRDLTLKSALLKTLEQPLIAKYKTRIRFTPLGGLWEWQLKLWWGLPPRRFQCVGDFISLHTSRLKVHYKIRYKMKSPPLPARFRID